MYAQSELNLAAVTTVMNGAYSCVENRRRTQPARVDTDYLVWGLETMTTDNTAFVVFDGLLTFLRRLFNLPNVDQIQLITSKINI